MFVIKKSAFENLVGSSVWILRAGLVSMRAVLREHEFLTVSSDPAHG